MLIQAIKAITDNLEISEEKAVVKMLKTFLGKEPTEDDFKLLTKVYPYGNVFGYRLFYKDKQVGQVDFQMDYTNQILIVNTRPE